MAHAFECRKSWILAAATLLFAGCATPQSEWKPAGYYVTDQLDSAAAADKDLLKELDDHRDQMVCWYETPEKDVELSLGFLCDSPLVINFHGRDAEWIVSSADRAIVQCRSAR